ncbi:Gfo/Idh/MocA family protein [Rhodobacter sp. CZR27]|uniref:Gfo/Idh/MocA family protein n=1 Tax=Rhodobacter sp. CZR27 TaxID=2033869 RepID=UPI000BBE17DC|nr:Gfo/Idh/MocA family oxidoreductase [Rhodobacter sp. CZR27]
MSRFAGREGPIRLGMVGGGSGAFIGAVHRIAARLDGKFQLVAGALSSTPERARDSAAALGLQRSYDSFIDMAKAEARRKDGIEAVAIVTPNHMHGPVAREFLKRGIHVICDKPLTATLAEAKRLQQAAERAEALFILTHNYTGYPMVRQARAMVQAGDLGALRVVQVEYPQGWMATPVANKQAEWRNDPARSGAGGATGDIGTHAYNLVRFVTGLKVEALAADLSAFVEGRQNDDNAHVLLRFEGGARGTLWCSQVAVGHENSLRLRAYGEKCALEWAQENPTELWFTPLGEPKRLITRMGAGAGPEAARVSRTPSGHPEGFLEAFANIYSEAAAAILAHREGKPAPEGVIFPTLADGMEGMAFIDACIRSSRRNAAWVTP